MFTHLEHTFSNRSHVAQVAQLRSAQAGQETAFGHSILDP